MVTEEDYDGQSRQRTALANPEFGQATTKEV